MRFPFTRHSLDFGTINSSQLDRSVGPVETLAGEFKEVNGKKVITKFKDIVVSN